MYLYLYVLLDLDLDLDLHLDLPPSLARSLSLYCTLYKPHNRLARWSLPNTGDVSWSPPKCRITNYDTLNIIQKQALSLSESEDEQILTDMLRLSGHAAHALSTVATSMEAEVWQMPGVAICHMEWVKELFNY